jgi:uncharacterized protein (TIGR00369 family)
MAMQEWSEFIKQHFNDEVPFIRFMGIRVLETTPGHARVVLSLDGRHANSYGMVHGGICAALVDTVTGIALRTLKHKIVTVEMTATYYAPVRLPGMLYATGDVVKAGKSILHAKAEVHTADGKLVAGGKAIYFIVGEDTCGKT